MKDMELTKFKKVWYYLCWVWFIASLPAIIWGIVVLILYLKDYNKPKVKGTLTKSYQKFIFIMGSIALVSLIIMTAGFAIFLFL